MPRTLDRNDLDVTTGDILSQSLPPPSFRVRAEKAGDDAWRARLATMPIRSPFEFNHNGSPAALMNLAESPIFHVAGYSALSRAAVVLLAKHAPARSVVSIGSGLGFCEYQLHECGFDVVGCDIKVDRAKAWLDQSRLHEIAPGEEGKFTALHADRMLFMAFPDRKDYPEAAARAYLRAGGETIAVLGPTSAGGILSARESFYRMMERLQRVDCCTLPDPLAGARGCRQISLSVYRSASRD